MREERLKCWLKTMPTRVNFVNTRYPMEYGQIEKMGRGDVAACGVENNN